MSRLDNLSPFMKEFHLRAALQLDIDVNPKENPC